jgi:hypothetical protein
VATRERERESSGTGVADAGADRELTREQARLATEQRRLDGREREEEQRRRVRTLVIGAAGISVPLAGIAFNLGAYGAIFYHWILTLWALATTTTIALLLLPTRERTVRLRNLLLMLVPTLALVGELVARGLLRDLPIIRVVFVSSFALALVVALPYTLYVIVRIYDEDLLDLGGWRIKAILVAVAVVVGGTAFLAGHFHEHFITCDDFQVAGDYVPEDCRDAPSNLILPGREPPSTDPGG